MDKPVLRPDYIGMPQGKFDICPDRSGVIRHLNSLYKSVFRHSNPDISGCQKLSVSARLGSRPVLPAFYSITADRRSTTKGECIGRQMLQRSVLQFPNSSRVLRKPESGFILDLTSICFKHSKEGFLWDTNLANLFHPFLTFLLFFKKLSFSCYITTITFGSNILS